MIKGTITFAGENEADVEAAIDEAKRLIMEGFTSGGNGNDTGWFEISVSSDE